MSHTDTVLVGDTAYHTAGKTGHGRQAIVKGKGERQQSLSVVDSVLLLGHTQGLPHVGRAAGVTVATAA